MQKKIDLSDFIFDEVKIKHDAKIDPNAKLKNFSNIRISLIDEKLKGEISGLIQNIRKNPVSDLLEYNFECVQILSIYSNFFIRMCLNTEYKFKFNYI